eukprot:357124-Chlamydomonas_euryale.AAC.1
MESSGICMRSVHVCMVWHVGMRACVHGIACWRACILVRALARTHADRHACSRHLPHSLTKRTHADRHACSRHLPHSPTKRSTPPIDTYTHVHTLTRTSTLPTRQLRLPATKTWPLNSCSGHSINQACPPSCHLPPPSAPWTTPLCFTFLSVSAPWCTAHPLPDTSLHTFCSPHPPRLSPPGPATPSGDHAENGHLQARGGGAERPRSLPPHAPHLAPTRVQEAARLMAAGEYEAALPVALDAVQQGQALFKPSPALQLFPLYLLAAQANLGLRRAKQCEDFLALASWLAMKEPVLTSNVMKSQLSRLYGQLYAFQVWACHRGNHTSTFQEGPVRRKAEPLGSRCGPATEGTNTFKEGIHTHRLQVEVHR